MPFVNRSLTSNEVEKLRLVLSTYQDGSGMLAVKNSPLTLPGWRDFERSVAAVIRGHAQESKAIFDVLIPDPDNAGVYYGIACKMRGTLRDTDRTGRVTIEVSNAAGEFWRRINEKGIDQRDYRQYPAEVGAALTEVVESWHTGVNLEKLVSLTCPVVAIWCCPGISLAVTNYINSTSICPTLKPYAGVFLLQYEEEQEGDWWAKMKRVS